MMGRKQKLIGGTEYDVIHHRGIAKQIWRITANARAYAKRTLNKRFRKTLRDELRKELND